VGSIGVIMDGFGFTGTMERLGVDEALRKAGIEEGETVRIGEFELEWQE